MTDRAFAHAVKRREANGVRNRRYDFVHAVEAAAQRGCTPYEAFTVVHS
jgi:hypothetical protein